jgi:hypothetical protein
MIPGSVVLDSQMACLCNPCAHNRTLFATGLQELAFWDYSETTQDTLYLQLTQLQKLTHLKFNGHVDGAPLNVQLSCEVGLALC